MNLFREIADSGEIKVNEFRHMELKTTYDPFGDVCKPYNIVVADAPTAEDICSKIHYIADYDYDLSKKSYSWEQIKDFFCVLTMNQFRLVNHEGLHVQSFWDEMLFEGASDYNIQLIQTALDHGANIKSLDSSGNSVLNGPVLTFRFLDETPFEFPQVIETLEFLLSKGADIDAFGYSGIPPIMEAYYAASPELTRFFIEKGANLNFNCYLMDVDPWPVLKEIKSTLISNLDEYDDYSDSPEIIEIERIVRDAYKQS